MGVVSIVLFITSLFGNSTQVVGSDVAVVGRQQSSYQPGQVIVFKNRTDNAIIAGYIVAAEGKGVYRRQRDAHDASDTRLVQTDQILGRRLFSVPGVGWLLTQARAIVAAVSGGVGAVWQSFFNSGQPVMIVTPTSTPVGEAATPSGEQHSPVNDSGTIPSGMGGVVTTGTPVPTVRAHATPQPIASVVASPTPAATTVPVSSSEITAGYLTLPAPTTTP